jgi:hypothetical protein
VKGAAAAAAAAAATAAASYDKNTDTPLLENAESTDGKW